MGGKTCAGPRPLGSEATLRFQGGEGQGWLPLESQGPPLPLRSGKIKINKGNAYFEPERSKSGRPLGQSFNRRAGLGVAIPSHDTDRPRFLRLRVRVSCPLSRMDAGRSQRVSRGLGQTVPSQGRQGGLSLSRAWASPVFYTTGPRRGEAAREATRNRNEPETVVFRPPRSPIFMKKQFRP